MNNLTKNLVLWLVIAMVLMMVFNNFSPTDQAGSNEIEYSTFLDEVHGGRVTGVEIPDDARNAFFD